MDFKTYLANDILVKMDRMAMASSLEVRSPFLDQEVVEFAARLPSDMKFRGRTAMYLLKRYTEQWVPASVIRRPKKGFSIPLSAWLRGDLRSTGKTYCCPSALWAGTISSPIRSARCGRDTSSALRSTHIRSGP